MYRFKYKTLDNFDDIIMESDGEYLTGLWFENSTDDKKHNEKFEKKELEIFNTVTKWLDMYFSHKKPFFDVNYKILKASDFQRMVWDILLNIPYGCTITYGEIAKIVAKQRGISKMSPQAVGHAVGSNPLCLIIPCHRVIGINGNLVGYGGGIKNKEQLLLLEQI